MLEKMPFTVQQAEPMDTAKSLLVFLSHQRPELLKERWAESLTVFDWVAFGYTAEQSMNALSVLKSESLLREKTMDGNNYYRLSFDAIEMIVEEEARLRQAS